MPTAITRSRGEVHGKEPASSSSLTEEGSVEPAEKHTMRTDGWANKVSIFGSEFDIELLNLELVDSGDLVGIVIERRGRDGDGLGESRAVVLSIVQ